MKITYFSYLWDIHGISAGSAIKAIEFLDAIKRNGHEVFLEWRTPQPAKNGRDAREVVRESIKPYIQKYVREPKRLAGNFKHLYQEYKLLASQNPDIFFPRLSYDNFSCLLLSKWLNLPTVVEADCPPTHEWQAFYARDDFKLGNLSLKLELALLNHADAVITQSSQLSNYYISKGVSAKKIVTIPNAADIRKFRPRPKKQALINQLNLTDRVVIGWIGAGVSWTGIEVLKEVFRDILKQFPQVSFLMLGSPENMEFFRANFQQNGVAERFVLPGFVPHAEIPQYLSCMDIVLAPYPKLDFFYASSMKLFEYMASGKAIVATRIGQIAEVIEEGNNGLLFDPDEPKELFDKLRLLIESPEMREKIGQNAREKAEREWNWNRVAEKMIDVFEQVLQKRRVGQQK